jgi:hypothetical protein
MPDQPDPAELALGAGSRSDPSLEARLSTMETNLNRLNETVGDLEARVEDALAKP